MGNGRGRMREREGKGKGTGIKKANGRKNRRHAAVTTLTRHNLSTTSVDLTTNVC